MVYSLSEGYWSRWETLLKFPAALVIGAFGPGEVAQGEVQAAFIVAALGVSIGYLTV